MKYLLIYRKDQLKKDETGRETIVGTPGNLIPCRNQEAYEAALERLAHTPKGCPVVVMESSRGGGYTISHGTVGHLLAGR